MGKRPWRHRHTPHTDEEATDAIRESRAERAWVIALWPKVNAVTDTLRKERELNHFAARFRAAYEGES